MLPKKKEYWEIAFKTEFCYYICKETQWFHAAFIEKWEAEKAAWYISAFS